jgi:hypothetical protein
VTRRESILSSFSGSSGSTEPQHSPCQPRLGSNAVLGATPIRCNSRQKAPGQFHVRSIAVPKAGRQVLFFGSRSDDQQTKQHNAGHKE